MQLTVQRFNNSSQPGSLETRVLQPSDRRKILDELGIDAAAQVVVRFLSQPRTWDNRLGSTDSSPDQTFVY